MPFYVTPEVEEIWEPGGKFPAQRLYYPGTGNPPKRPHTLANIRIVEHDFENSKYVVETSNAVVPEDWIKVTQEWIEENYPGVL